MEWTSIAPLVGVLVGSVLTLVGQWLTDARAVRRDRLIAEREAEQRHKTDWVLLRRETIVELQVSLELIWASYIPSKATPPRESVAEAFTKVLTLTSRLEEQGLADEVRLWLEEARRHNGGNRETLLKLQDRLGRLLRGTHNP